MGDIAIAFNANGVEFLSPGLQRDVATLGCDESQLDNPARVELLDVWPEIIKPLQGFRFAVDKTQGAPLVRRPWASG